MTDIDWLKSKKMFDRVSVQKKEHVYDHYVRLVYDFKDYGRITRKKMLEEIYELYSDYHYIIDLCTARELKFLQKVLAGKVKFKDITDRRRDWTSRTLRNKFLIIDNATEIFLPEEIEDQIKLALKNVDWQEIRKRDQVNEFILGYAKIMGTFLLDPLATITAYFTNTDAEDVKDYIASSPMINYYILYYDVPAGAPYDESATHAAYAEYDGILEEIDLRRAHSAVPGTPNLDPKRLSNIFYYDFDIDNPKIKPLLEEFEDNIMLEIAARDHVIFAAILNLDRDKLKRTIKSIPILKNYDLTDFFKVLDPAMDEMPSAVFNGLTPNEAKSISARQQKVVAKVKKSYKKQKPLAACLSRRDAKMFYKIYFGLLEFTNERYQIIPGLKLFRRIGIDPTQLSDIIEQFWAEKDTLVPEFCEQNPFHFNPSELAITESFQQGIRDIFFMVRFEKDTTAFYHDGKFYMVKGINDNLDDIISYRDLPLPVRTTIIPFMGCLVYDGILGEYSVMFDPGLSEEIERAYDKAEKIYYL